MGEVHLVHDPRLGREVAEKRLSRQDPDLIVRFKREFRTLFALTHPSLVRLFELGDDGGLYFTMEAVEGPDLRAHCVGPAWRERLREVLPAVVAGLRYLHARGVVHRDLKPTHVIVTGPRDVKLLDFGLLAEVGREGSGAAVGTPAYMAPEQLRGEGPTPAFDAWALGVILAEIAGGHPPFGRLREEVLEGHRAGAALRVAALPPDLRALCLGLLEEEPAKRAGLDAVLSWCSDGAVRDRRSDAPSPTTTPFVGRDALVASLEAAARGNARFVLLSGPSGAGKSAVLAALASSMAARGEVPLSTRARPSERLAFHAVDSAVDGLAEVLRAGSLATPAPRALGAAATAFPALAVTGAARRERTRLLSRSRLFGGADGAAARRDTFAAFADLLGAIEGRVWIFVDDLQWADGDSLALLTHVLEAEKARVIAGLRDDLPREHIESWLEGVSGLVRVALPDLPEAVLAAIAAAAARARGTTLGDEEAASIARRSLGRPLLAEMLGRARADLGESASGDAFEATLRALSVEERRALVAVSLAEEWVDPTSLAAVVESPEIELHDRLVDLERRGLVRRTFPQAAPESLPAEGHPTAWRVDVYHDRVRTLALEVASAEERRALHAAFADRERSDPRGRNERIVRHLLGAGLPNDVRPYAEAAARSAVERRAFALAAEMYAVAADHAGRAEALPLREARARMLERAGQYAPAADQWRALVVEDRSRLDWALAEAYARIAAGDAALGMRRLDATLLAAGEPSTDPSGVAAVVGAVRFLLGPRGALKQRAAAQGAELVQRAEQEVGIGKLLCFLDPLSGLSFLVRARDRFLAAGASEHVAACDHIFAVVALIGSRDVPVALASRYVASAERMLEGRPWPIVASGMSAFVRGLDALRRGDWDPAIRAFDEAKTAFRDAHGTTELMMSASWRTMPDVYRQDLGAIRDHLAWFDARREEVGETFIVAHVELLRGYEAFLSGDFDGGFRAVDGITRRFRTDRDNVQTAAAYLYRHLPSPYLGDVPRARRDFDEHLRRAGRFRFFDTMYAGPLASVGALLEAAALRVGDPDASVRRLERFCRVIDRSPPLAAGTSWRARAYAADAAGRPEECVRLLRLAETVAARHGRRVDVAIARHQLGLRIGGDEGRALVADAGARLDREGVARAMLAEDPRMR